MNADVPGATRRRRQRKEFLKESEARMNETLTLVTVSNASSVGPPWGPTEGTDRACSTTDGWVEMGDTRQAKLIGAERNISRGPWNDDKAIGGRALGPFQASKVTCDSTWK